jgi:hypothetical protein
MTHVLVNLRGKAHPSKYSTARRIHVKEAIKVHGSANDEIEKERSGGAKSFLCDCDYEGLNPDVVILAVRLLKASL